MVMAVALYNLHDFSWAPRSHQPENTPDCAFIFILNPTATHAIVDAGFRAGLRPWTQKDKKGKNHDLGTGSGHTVSGDCGGHRAIQVKDLLGAAILFGAYSFLMCLLWAIMGAVDVAFTEASVGAGVSTVFFVAAVFRTTRRTKD
jgi:energy-converting hydrogenase B subunit D